MAAQRWGHSPTMGGPSHPCWTPHPNGMLWFPQSRWEKLHGGATFREQLGIFLQYKGFILHGVWAHLASEQVGMLLPSGSKTLPWNDGSLPR